MRDAVQLSDADLAAAVIRGGPEAAAAERIFCDRFRPRVRAYGLRHLRDPVAADDLAQEVLLIALSRLRAGEVREPDRIASFVLGTARMTTVGFRRTARRGDALADRLARQPGTTAGMREPLELDRLARCMEALSERERTVVLLTFHDDRTGPEIGTALGVSPGNVRVIRHRAVAALQRCMGVDGGDR